MAYYIFLENGKINGCGQCPTLNEEIQNIAVTESIYNAYIAEPEKFIYVDGEIVENPNYEEEQKQKERERLDMLFMTGSDVERAIYKVKGIDFDDILTLLKDNPTIDVKALKIEFKANNFYRGNPYISQVGTFLGFTSVQMDKFFDTKDYHYLTTCELTIKVVPEKSTVTINDIEQKGVTMPYGSQVTYKIDCEGYKSVEEVLTLTEDKTLEITLEKIEDDNTDTTTDNADTVQDELQSETD